MSGTLRDLIADPTAAELALIALYGEFTDDARRERAFRAFADTGLPHRLMEAFKWTDFRRSLPAIENGHPARPDLFAPLGGTCIRFRNGTVSGLESLPDGIRAVIKHEGHALADSEDLPMGALTAALSRDTLMLEVTAAIKTPVRLVYEGAGETQFARCVFMVRPDAAINVIESHLGGAGLNASLSSFTVQAGGRVTRTLVQPSSIDEVLAVTADVNLEAEASYVQTALAFGGKLARIETRLVHRETGSRAILNAAYLAGKGHHIDLTSHVRHGAPACQTRQRTKGAVTDGGTGIFQGKFLVPRIVGQRTDADMQHNALLLDDGATVNAKPELEIYADDVECAHGNTCGSLDAEQVFYMRQRGIPEDVAKALLTEAFIAEALETAPEAARELMLEAARHWLSEAT